jgi:hypothetical protein
MSPVAADRASADRAPGGEAEALAEEEPAGAVEPLGPDELDAEPLEAEELVEELDEDPQPTATSERVATAAVHRFGIESMRPA